MQRDFVRRYWWVYLGAMLTLLLLTAGVSLLMPTGFLKGLVVGGFLVGGGAALWSLTVQVTGTAPVMMGDTAEMWTAMELRRLQSRGWRIVNHFVLAKDDIDHVLVGPGGAYVVETKWATGREVCCELARLKDRPRTGARVSTLRLRRRSRAAYQRSGARSKPASSRRTFLKGVATPTRRPP